MKLIFELSLFLFAGFVTTSATFFGFPPRPFSSLCRLEKHFRIFSYGNSWQPQCANHGSRYAAEQCTKWGDCWCVNTRNGKPITFESHDVGEVNCLETIQACPENQVYSECAGCDKTCENKDTPIFCTLQCRQKCTCPSGLVLDGERCVERDECPPTCPENQVYSECAGCDRTCENKDTPIPCLAVCRQKCTCPDGLVLNGERCVERDECPACNQTLNEVYRTCAPPCDATCKEPRLVCSLLKSCNKRCACKKRQVRNQDGVCVYQRQCPPPVPTCPENQVYSECAGCDITCENKDTPLLCTLQCRQKCTCPHGLVLDGERCVERDECPPTCPENQVYSECAGCDRTCENKDTPIPCLAVCRQKCTCPDGLVLNGERCVKRDECPACNQTLNEVYRTCAPPCDATCEEPRLVCSLLKSCNKRCACKKGQVRNQDGVCVYQRQCSPPVPTCPENQVYSECAGCDRTCENKDTPIPCLAVCRQKCTCPDGLVLNGERCVERDECPVCDASLNEVFRTCAPPCDATCDEPGKLCSLQESCNRRCACAGRQVRSEYGVCVDSDKCPERIP